MDKGIKHQHEFNELVEDLRQLTDIGKLSLKSLQSFVTQSKNDKLFLMKVLRITIPNDYDESNLFAKYAERFKKRDEDICQLNFSDATDKLLPGKEYFIYFWGIKTGHIITKDDVLQFMNDCGYLKVGVAGLFFTWFFEQVNLPFRKFILSFDESINLSKDQNNYALLPYIKHYTGKYILQFKHFIDNLQDNVCIICFSETT